MKPKNKLQQTIVSLSEKLKPISESQKQWAINQLSCNYGVISRKTTFCLECGHQWKNKEDISLTRTCVCPQCSKQLVYHPDHRVNIQKTYIGMLTTKNNMQVVRIFMVSQFFKKRNQTSFSFNEVIQHWISPDGQLETITKLTNGMGYDADAWLSGGKLEPRSNTARHQLHCSINPLKIYPGRKILPLLKRNGFKGFFYGMTPQHLFSFLLKNNVAETLLKAGQVHVLDHFLSSTNSVTRFWDSIKICIRNNYKISDAGLWFDYLELLEFFQKDLRNPKYVCPIDLKKEHDYLSLKKTKIQAEKDNRNYQSVYVKQKSQFFPIALKENNLTIEPLKSIDEFIEEAHNLKHCVYSNEYFKKEKSLILSAKINNMPVETVELNLDSFRISQSRGLSNKRTKYHNRILNLVETNINQFIEAAS